MGFTTLNLGLELTIPTNGTKNWGTNTFNTTWTKISGHGHTGSGDGQQIVSAALADGSITTIKIDDLAVTTAKIADLAVTTIKIADLAVTTAKIVDDAVTGAKIRLDNDEWLRWRNAADSADINVLKVDATDQILLGSASSAVVEIESLTQLNLTSAQISLNSTDLIAGSQILIGNGKQVHQNQVADLVVVGAAQTIDWDNGNYQRLDLQTTPADAAVTLTLSNPQAGAWYGVEILQGSNASVLTWGAGVTWAQGEDPSSNGHMSTADGAKDHVMLYYNGTEYKAYWDIDFS